MANPKKKRNKNKATVVLIFIFTAILISAVYCAVKVASGRPVYADYFDRMSSESNVKNVVPPDYVSVQLIKTVGTGHARTGEKLEAVRNIVVHYVGNPGTTASNNLNYFNLPDTRVSSHFIIGLEGEIIQCVPLDEQSSATNYRNKDTVSIEVCHPDTSGKFTDLSYTSLVKLTAWLCSTYGLDEGAVIRHYDVTGKECPLYFVDHEDEWEIFKNDVGNKLYETRY